MSGDARRAQEEANGNTAEQEEADDDEMGTQGYTSGNVSEEEKTEEEYRDNDMTARDIINSQQIAICLDEPREAQYMAGFIALQMSRMWGMFEAGDKRRIDAALRGTLACPYHNDLSRYPNIAEVDRAGIFLPSTARRRFLNLRVLDQGLLDQSWTAISLFAFRRLSARGCTSSTNCGVRQL